MLKNFLIVLFACVMTAFGLLRHFAEQERRQADPHWVLGKNWQPDTQTAAPSASEDELRFIRALKTGSSENQELLGYFRENKCKEPTEHCYQVTLLGAALVQDANEQDVALRAAITGYDLIRRGKTCPAMAELIVLRFKLHQLNAFAVDQAQDQAEKILDRIRRKGGLLDNLRSDKCHSLRFLRSPLLDQYALQVAQVMWLAGGEYPRAASLIEASVKH